MVRHGDRACRHDRRDRVLVDHLRDRVLEQDHVLVERFDLSLQLDAVDEIDRYLNVLLAKRVQEGVLQHLPFIAHLGGSALVVGHFRSGARGLASLLFRRGGGSPKRQWPRRRTGIPTYGLAAVLNCILRGVPRSWNVSTKKCSRYRL